MDFGHYDDHVVRAAADLVNTRGSTSGTEFLPELGDLRAFLREHHFMTPEAATDGDLQQLRAFRERLREVFHAGSQDEAARLLNRLLAELPIRPLLTDHDGTWHMHYVADDAPVWQRVASATAMGLAIVVAEHGFERLGVCQADDCEDVYVDTSRNRSRRYCNDLCTTRMNVAAYRARKR